MSTGKEYGVIDRFRVAAAILIVGIHTYPLMSVSEVANFYLIHVFGRVAVPFFLMVTGYFLLPRYFRGNNSDAQPLLKFIKKTGLVYVLATLLYLPISIYAGHYDGGNLLATIARNIVFDGTFYHLWYLPASIIGVLIVYALRRMFPQLAVIIIACVLYIIGLFGDNYYYLAYEVSVIRQGYDLGFRVFSYTRNGLFYAPIFIVMGASIAMLKTRVKTWVCVVGLVVSLFLMMIEGYVLRHFALSRHSSMYIALLPCMFFLFNTLRDAGGMSSAVLRNISMWIFILHPLFIVVVRGLARGVGLTGLLVDNSVMHFLAVCMLTVVASGVCVYIQYRYKGRAKV